jgi:hypothetical protein
MIQWLGQPPAICPPGTFREVDSKLCFPIPDELPKIETLYDEPPVPPALAGPTVEEKRNQMLLIAGGIVALGLLAYSVLK